MKAEIKTISIDNVYNLVIMLMSNGGVYYRIESTSEWKYSNYTIMKSVHNYYVARMGNRLDKLMQGTKKECLDVITELLRTAFSPCKGKD